MNPLEELPYLGKTLSEAEEMLRAAGYKEWEVVKWGESTTLHARRHPVLFLNKDGKINKIW